MFDVAILADSVLLYLVALMFLTFLGIGFSAWLLPRQLSPFRWLLAPYLGYCGLVVGSGLLVAFGASISIVLVVVGLAGLATLVHAAARGALGVREASSCWWLLLPAMGLPQYAITALSMAHNGTMAYVGPNLDVLLHVPLAEWLKNHAAPMFSLGIPPSLDPNWNSSRPPFDGWPREGSHLQVMFFGEDSFFPLQRGAIYLASSLGLLLGWDSYRVLRPELAFLLALAPPAVFVFCRQAVRAGLGVSLLAALLTSLNGTIFFWVSLAHIGQSASMFMVPLVCLLTLSAVEDHSRSSRVAAALALAAASVTYYLGQPLVLGLAAAGVIFVVARSGQWSGAATRTATIGLAFAILAFPDHLRVLLDWRIGALTEISGWGHPRFPPISDALGTTLDVSVLEMVAGQGQIAKNLADLMQIVTMAATAIALLLGVLGAMRGRAERVGLLRSMLLAGLAAMAYLRLFSDYPYAAVKAQTVVTFLLSISVALGLEVAWGRATAREIIPRLTAPAVSPRALAVGASALFLAGTAAMNLGLGAYAFWKPVGNIFNTSLWEAEALTRIIPAGATVRLSPNIVADPEVVWLTLYFLRNQNPVGPPSHSASLVPHRDQEARPVPEFDVLGASEVAAAAGYGDLDRVWAGSLLQAYRVPPLVSEFAARIESQDRVRSALPSRLPATIELAGRETGRGAGSPAMPARLVLGIAAEHPSTLMVAAGGERRALAIEKGVSVRSLPVQAPDRVSLSIAEGDRAALLFLHLSPDRGEPLGSRDYGRLLAAFGESELKDGRFLTDFTYLDIGVPASHSLDVFGAARDAHAGWFELPTNPDGRLKEVRFDLDPTNLGHSGSVNGEGVDLAFSTRPVSDGEYTAYFTVALTGAQPIRIPLYGYRLQSGKISDVKLYPLRAMWDGRSDLANWK